jgi:hypothetical protein
VPRRGQIEDVKRGNRFGRVNVIGALCKRERYSIKCYKHTAEARFFESWFEEHLLKEIPYGNGYTIERKYCVN